MKIKIIISLLILSLLTNVFLFSNDTKILKTQAKELKTARDKIKKLEVALNDAQYFTLDNNTEAQNYFETLSSDQVKEKVTNDFLALQDVATGHPLIPYDSDTSQKKTINKLTIINHRWLLADFYAGTLHGEILVAYFIEDGKTSFELIKTTLFTQK